MKKINANKLIGMAETMEKQAEDKLRPRDTHTAKKLAQARHAELEGQHLKRAANLIRDLVRAATENRVPTLIQNTTLTKDRFMQAAKLETARVSNGYHDYLVEKDTYYYHDPFSEALRSLDSMSPERQQAMEERKKELALRRAIDSVRNCDIPGFFPTPESVIKTMLSIVDQHLVQGVNVLEPSAGLGDIVDEIKKQCPSAKVDAVECNHSLCEILRMKNVDVDQSDFMEWNASKLYDVVVMNPPYERKQAIKHSTKAYHLLKTGGVLVSLMPPNHAEETIGLLQDEGCCAWAIEPVGDGAFNNREAFRRTGVSVAIVYAVKHDASTVDEEISDYCQGLLF